MQLGRPSMSLGVQPREVKKLPRAMALALVPFSLSGPGHVIVPPRASVSLSGEWGCFFFSELLRNQQHLPTMQRKRQT